MNLYQIEVRNRETKEWEVSEEVEAKSRRSCLHKTPKDTRSRHDRLRFSKVQWRCVLAA